ncbi:hypothetical protein A8924_2436 [Saccharopolyspora erythraea NRRL 2338]|uniref:Uncharacterized protein n=2 Tax=Saccharopolyspora erythraea TaxID=1836 RepID=A4FBB8_SACEN|nr:hypothetical protein [Saccharopolyspora erythraea]EQD86460.1 hypothetical protein N599_09410 [Saccharopolyspora erythraea D]PFG95125.1 hypothetical protein A8924_2436 [Saccharopolyspora erythraea NRRL 2338]QRK91799.1 hypothetical protein JQX30_10730 [Saccharopolyspora erythraea]CAM01343.1 hypothetical protein SACE_2033 [Saccharopolyspora erythraea NRRL 2338]
MTEPEVVPLDLLDRATIRKRSRNVAIAALIVAAAMGGIVGLVGGPLGFGITAGVVALPLLALAYFESRKTCWMQGTMVSVRAAGTRRVELKQATRLDLFVTDMRGARTVNLLVGGPPKNKAISISLAMYAGTGGRELGVYPLRRLADALASTGDTRALVLSELVVAQLKSEARGDGAPDRPLYRLASLAPQGRMAQRLHPDAVARFVTALD